MTEETAPQAVEMLPGGDFTGRADTGVLKSIRGTYAEFGIQPGEVGVDVVNKVTQVTQ